MLRNPWSYESLKKHDPTRFLDIVWRDWEDYCCCYSLRRKLCKIRHVTLWIQIQKSVRCNFAKNLGQMPLFIFIPNIVRVGIWSTEVMISPDGKVFYHRKDAEKHWGQVGRDGPSCECDMGKWENGMPVGFPRKGTWIVSSKNTCYAHICIYI